MWHQVDGLVPADFRGNGCVGPARVLAHNVSNSWLHAGSQSRRRAAGGFEIDHKGIARFVSRDGSEITRHDRSYSRIIPGHGCHELRRVFRGKTEICELVALRAGIEVRWRILIRLTSTSIH